ncbi:hypothetical protein TSUD_164140 [Trifolium subterraneum]|uniref:Uncharacterized protein n=1 Tax=Trifolium subterraneum TaxID=3900 RepID=A0A2Z6M724_TRISU|nr:hypothetical protein TSUD_164140 [Trifolium subterraneum]
MSSMNKIIKVLEMKNNDGRIKKFLLENREKSDGDMLKISLWKLISSSILTHKKGGGGGGTEPQKYHLAANVFPSYKLKLVTLF